MTGTDEALVLAGGLGTRLRSVVQDVPKPLAPIDGRPFVAWLLDALVAQGMRRIVLATGYLGDVVERELGTTWAGAALAYSRETEPLGTGGAIALAVNLIEGDSFFVLNGDTWLGIDYRAFDAQSEDDRAPLAMALAHVDDTARYGAVRVQDAHVAGFVEKGQSGPGYINAGVYRLTRRMLDAFPGEKRFSFEKDVLEPAVVRGDVGAYTRTEGFIDIGVPEDYARAASVLPVSGGAP
jgi:D-glycero-alpha-D-manno-heptose 1-phosphate guanylyltransferase